MINLMLPESTPLPQGNRAELEAELLMAKALQRLPCYDGATRDRRIRRYLAAVEAVVTVRHGTWPTAEQVASVVGGGGG